MLYYLIAYQAPNDHKKISAETIAQKENSFPECFVFMSISGQPGYGPGHTQAVFEICLHPHSRSHLLNLHLCYVQKKTLAKAKVVNLCEFQYKFIALSAVTQ